MNENEWGANAYRVGTEEQFKVSEPEKKIEEQKKRIEPWLSAVFQSEHLSLLLGSGFTTALAVASQKNKNQENTKLNNMSPSFDDFPLFKEEIKNAAKKSASKMGRGKPNIEDQIRTANTLLQGLEIQKKSEAEDIRKAIDEILKRFLGSMLQTEQVIRSAIENAAKGNNKNAKPSDTNEYKDDSSSITDDNNNLDALVMLVSFLLSFSSRTASRERLHIFTTNYDRLIEYGADLAGLHMLDRFVGALEPIFRSSRLDIDMHYNPPGIRGEPRYLEGVVRLTKLHGSLDWIYRDRFIRKIGLPFGADGNHPAIISDPGKTVMVYPNYAKDRETAEYPYVELFRDYAAAVCRPNSVLVTYGYGYGDEHINRVIEDMLTIPSAHLVIISFSDEGGRISGFCNKIGRKAQISLLIGPHFGAMPNLIENYLPKPAIDRITIRQTDLLRNRGWDTQENKKKSTNDNGEINK
jgi:hypothetical protein